MTDFPVNECCDSVTVPMFPCPSVPCLIDTSGCCYGEIILNLLIQTLYSIILYIFMFGFFFFLCWGMNWGLVHARPGQIRSFSLGTIHEGFSTGKSGYIVQPTIHYTLFLMPVKIGSQDHFSRNLGTLTHLILSQYDRKLYHFFFYSEMKQSWK